MSVKKKLATLALSLLVASTMAACFGGTTPTPTPTPPPPPTPPIVTPNVNYTDINLPTPEITVEVSNAGTEATLTYNKNVEAVDYEVRYAEKNAGLNDSILVIDDNKEDNIVEIKELEDGDYNFYVKAIAPSKESQKSESDKGDKNLWVDSEYATEAFTIKDQVKAEFLEFYNTLNEYVDTMSKFANGPLAQLKCIYAFNHYKTDGKFEVWFNVFVRGENMIEKYIYSIPGVENNTTFKELTNSLKTVEPKSASRDFRLNIDNFGNSYGVDCWDTLTTTDKLGEDTNLKQALNNPSFEKVLTLTRTPLSSSSYVLFDIMGLAKVNYEGKDKLVSFKETITQKITATGGASNEKYLHYFNDGDDCTIWEAEFRELSDMNFLYEENIKKYIKLN